jgi:hypothetical protein
MKHGDRASDVVSACVRDWFAVVERLDLRKFVGMLLQQIAEAPDEARPIGGRNP